MSWTSQIRAKSDWVTFEPGAVFIPSAIEIQNGTLIWTMNDPAFKVPRGSVLEKFRRLHKQPAQVICDFAREFGVAWFCQHHLPGSHGQIPFGRQFGLAECFPVATPAKNLRNAYEEDLDDYRKYSRAADAIVTAAAMVNSGEVPSDGTLTRFCFVNRPLSVNASAFPQFALLQTEPLEYPPSEEWLRNRNSVPRQFLLESARMQIEEEVSCWVAISQARPHVSWNYRSKTWRQTIRHSPWGVLGAVALALFTTVPLSQGWLICSVCGGSYEPRRPAVPGRNHCCKNCRYSKGHFALLKRQERAKKEKQK